MKKELILIQPHSDDILFSAASFLFDMEKYKSVTVYTVENNPKRIAEDEKLKDYFPNLIIHTSNVDYIESSHGYFKTHKEFEEKSAFAYLESVAGISVLNRYCYEVQEYLQKRIKKAKGNILIVTCLGVGHPFHQFVTETTKDFADLFYREFPHSYKRRNKNYFETITMGDKSDFVEVKNPFAMNFPSSAKEYHDLKFQIASKIYRSQSGLLFYEQGYIKKELPEQFYKKR